MIIEYNWETDNNDGLETIFKIIGRRGSRTGVTLELCSFNERTETEDMHHYVNMSDSDIDNLIEALRGAKKYYKEEL